MTVSERYRQDDSRTGESSSQNKAVLTHPYAGCGYPEVWPQ